MIKSALEIALERTKDVKSDKKSLHTKEIKNKGKQLASRYLDPAEKNPDIKKSLKEYKGEEAGWFREGFFDVLVSNIMLPQDDQFKEQLDTIESALEAVVSDKKTLNYLFQQSVQFFEQYLTNQEQVRQGLAQQYAPQLRKKEEQLTAQLGSEVKLDPMQDPDFAKLLKDNLNQLDAQFSQVLHQLKDELRKLFT